MLDNASLLIKRSDVVYSGWDTVGSFVVGLMYICSSIEVEMASDLADRLEDEGSSVERLEDTDVAGCDVVNSFECKLEDTSLFVERSDVVSRLADVGSSENLLDEIDVGGCDIGGSLFCRLVDASLLVESSGLVFWILDIVGLYVDRLIDP